MRPKDDTGDDTTTTRSQAKQERVAQSSSIPERTNEAEIISSGIVSQSPFLTLAPPPPPAPPATPSQTAKRMLSPIASTPRQSMSRHGFVPPMTPSASASGSIQWIPQITPSSTGTGTGAGGVSRRRLSTNLLSKVSVFESTLSLHSTHSDIHASIEFQSPAPSVNEPLTKKSPTTTPTFFPSTPQSSQRRSQRRDSLASKLIHQFNEKVQSPHQSAKLYSPRQVKQLVRLSGGSSHLKNYITESLHSPNQKSTSPHNDEDDSDNDFGGDTPDAPPTLSPHEVRALIESNAKSKLVHGSHEISPEKVHSKSVSDDVLATTTQQHNLDAAKLRQRKCLNDAPPLITTTTTTATATATNDEVKRPLLPEIPSTTSRMHATATNNSTAAHKAIRNQTLDIVNFVPPQFSKSEEQSALIQEKINEIFVFSELQGNNMEPLIDAFEPLKATPGIEIHAEDEHFYIVQHGEVDIHVDGIMVGRAGRGDCFGEEALLHQSSHSNTTLMATHENTAQLLRLDNRSFRGIVQSHAMESMETKRKIIQGVDFLKPILEQDDQLIHRLASLLVRQQFLQDEEFTVNEEKTFHIVEFGSLRLTNASGTLNFLLEPGDYFGERALLGNLPNKATGEVTMKGASPNKGVFYSMDRGEVEHILGRDRLQKLHDLHTFSKATKLQSFWGKIDRVLADCIQRKQFDEGQSLLQEELPDEPAVYVVREGTALVKYVDAEGKAQEKSVGVGEVFGHEHLTSHEDAQMRRPDGYTAVGKDGPVAVGVLPLRDIQRVSQHDDQAGDKAVNATASLRLQQKIREAVKAKISLDAFEKISVLGEGQFGEVWLVAADVFQTGVDSMKQRFALKSQNLDDEIRGSEATEAIRREIDILESLTQNCPHPGIVNLVNTYEDEKSIYMLMGLISGGELWSRIHQEDGEGNWHSGMTECDAKFYTYVVADTLGFMHLQHIVFRDLKPENIMLDDDGYPVIVDFGFAKRVPQGEKTFTFCGTPNYVAPEVILHSGHDKGVDYWALGITMYEMVAGVNPFYYDGLDNVTLYNTICQEQFYAYPKEISPELLDLTHELLDKNAGTRLGSLAGGVNDILSHGWFAGFDLQRYRSKEIEAPWKPHVDTDHVLDEEAMEEVLASFISNVPNQSTSFHSYLKEQAVFYNPLHGFEEIDEEQDVSDTCEFHSYVDGDQDEWSGTEFDAEEEKEEDSEPTKSPMSQPFGLPSSVTRFESESMEEATLNSGLDGSASKRPADPPAICVSVPNEPRKGESRPSLFDSSSKGSLSRSDSGVSLSQSERSTSADNEDLSNINLSRRSSLSRSDSGNSAMNRSERGSLSASGIHRPRMSWRQKEKSKMARRSTIQGALADLGLDDDPMDDFKNP